MTYQIAIYILFILPISINYYKKDGKKWLFSKIINSIITLGFFIIFASNVNRLLFGITDGSYLVMKNVSTEINIVFSVFYGILSLFAGIQGIRLAFRMESARVYFLWLIPLFWILTAVDKFYVYLELINMEPDLLFFILVFAMYAFVWGALFLFYSKKSTKEFFKASFLSPDGTEESAADIQSKN